MAEESRTVRDPICGKEVDTFRARAVGIYAGVTYYFCSPECKSKYVDPRKNTAPRSDGPERRREVTGPNVALPAQPPASLAAAPPPAGAGLAAASPSTPASGSAAALSGDTGSAESAFDDAMQGDAAPDGGKRSPMVFLVVGLVLAAGIAAIVLH